MARLCVTFLVLTDRIPTCPARNSTQQLLVLAGEASVLLKRQRRQSHIPPTTTIFGSVQGTWRDCLRIPWRKQLEPIPHWVADGPCSKMLADKHANAPTPDSRPADSARAYSTSTKATLPCVRGCPVVMQTSDAATEKLRSEEALYIAPNSNITPLGLYRDPRPELEQYSAPQIIFSDWVMKECCPDLANSQHREDMSKAPPSLTIRSAVSAVFGGRWACAHLAANAGVGRTRAAVCEDSKPASAINSFKLLCTPPHVF